MKCIAECLNHESLILFTGGSMVGYMSYL